MNPLDNNKNGEVAKYFKNLGYEYSWDFSRRDGLYWHEIIHPKEGLIIQVEMVPLEVIIRDMCIVEEIKLDYFIAGGQETNELYDELCKKVREFESSRNRK